MNYEKEAQKGAVKVTFTVTDEEWNDELNGSYNRNKNKYTVPGFRKGHASRKMIENMYGAGVFFDDAFNACFKRVYTEMLSKEPEIYPVDDPQVDFVPSDKGLKFTAVITVKPEVTLGQYKGIKIPKVEYNVTETEIDAEIDRARERASREVEVDRPVEKGDKVNLDYSGSVDGVKFDGGTAEGQELTIGSGSFIPGFEDQMIGMKKGEEKDLQVEFPAEYHSKDLAGKKAVFHVKVNEIRVKELPELNDEFAKSVSEFDNVADYRKSISERMRKSAAERADRENENALMEEIVKCVSCDVPDCMVNDELEYMLRDLEYRISHMYGGMKIEDYFKYTGTSREDFRKARREQALNTVKLRLGLEAIIKAENIEATADDVKEQIRITAEGAGKSAEEFEKTVGERERAYLKSDALMRKVVEFLKTNNVFEVVKEKPAKKPAAKSSAKSGSSKTATAKAAVAKEEDKQ